MKSVPERTKCELLISAFLRHAYRRNEYSSATIFKKYMAGMRFLLRNNMFADESSKIYLPPNFQPSSRDVICARGKQAFLHPGNKRFREIIAMNITSYASAESKNEKSSIVWRIIEDVGTGANGGFVKYCSTQKLWYRLGDAASSKFAAPESHQTLSQLTALFTPIPFLITKNVSYQRRKWVKQFGS